MTIDILIVSWKSIEVAEVDIQVAFQCVQRDIQKMGV